MTTPPDRPEPPELIPGEPLWGTPEIAPPEQPPAAGRPARDRRGSGPTATGSARPPTGHVQPPPPPSGPVGFGATPSTAPPSGGYGRATTYGDGEPRDGHRGGQPSAARFSAVPLVITGVVCLVIGMLAGLALGYLFL